MEKLIELLNEYEIWKGKNGLDITQQYAEHNFKYNKWLYIRVISKKYKFIKRLVENKKIDVAKFGAVWKYESRDYWEDKEGNVTNYYYDNFEKHSDYESLLMLLAISDTPIEDLISYLR